MHGSIHFRWLGVAGIELSVGDEILAIDPFFTRPPFWRFWLGRVPSNHSVASEKLPRGKHILVTHPHYDHLMDVPGLAASTGAQVYGSANTCRICLEAGVPANQVHEISVGQQLELGVFTVEVMPAIHIRLPADRLVNGKLADRLRFPMRLRDYRMDTCFSFLIVAQGQRLLIGDSPVPAEVLFYIPLRPGAELERIHSIVQPRITIPIHWDDFFSPLSRPIRPSFQPPSRFLFRLQRLNMDEFKRQVEAVSPQTRVLVPEIFKIYSLDIGSSPQNNP